MKGLKVKPETLHKILSDYKWNKFIVYDKNHKPMIDLKKYSEGKCYLPIGDGFSNYIDGFLFTNDLYECPYRTQDDLVYLVPDVPKPPKIIKYREAVMPKIKGVCDGDGASSKPPEIDYIEKVKISR